MTAIGDHCNVIRDWLNFEHSDALITSWTRMAEEYLSEHLRCKHMVQIDRAVVTEGRVPLPSDWLELDYVRIDGGKPLRYRERDAFFSNPTEDQYHNEGFYTITGNYLMVGGPVSVDDGKAVELSYYQSIPPLGDDPNWLMTYYTRLYVTATLSAACAYSIEDERAVMWQASVDQFVSTINAASKAAHTSGSVLAKRSKRGFG